MSLPVPNNKLVAFTLAGALLTALVAGALAVPISDFAQSDSQSNTPDPTDANASQQLGADAPTPNGELTPDVQTQTGYDEDEEYEDDEDEEYEDDEEVGEDAMGEPAER